MHKSITFERIRSAIEEDDCIGFCKKCGEEQNGCEPDARHYECDSCGAEQVFGAEELLLEIF
jgi:hypothetical protein